MTKRVKHAAQVVVGAFSAAGTSFMQAFKNHDPHSPFKMLLIGETGSGKTSFLNLLYNCGTVQALGCGFGRDGLEQFRQFNDIRLENAKEVLMASKTSKAKLYNVQVGDLKVGIIDTPGFGDSRGIKQDEENTEQIISALRDEDYVNCVCLIINGRQARASASLKYVLTEITAILPREILNNVIVVFSNTSDPLDLNFEPKSLTEYFGNPVQDEYIFFVENPYCRFEKAKAKIEQLGIDKVAKSLQKSFEDTASVLRDMCNAIKDLPQVHTHSFIVLYEKKQAIESNVFELLTAYDNQLSLEKSIKRTEEEVDAAVRSKTLNKDFRTTRHTSRQILDKTARYNTLCAYNGCHRNCHIECNLPKSIDKEAFRSCACVTNGTCSVCGHSYIHHYHEHFLFREVHETKELVDREMQGKFEEAASDQNRAQLLYTELAKQKAASEAEKARLSEELLKKISEFEELGIARNYVKLTETQLAVIETRLKGTTGKECDDLRKTKEQLEKKLKLVKQAKAGTTA